MYDYVDVSTVISTVVWLIIMHPSAIEWLPDPALAIQTSLKFVALVIGRIWIYYTALVCNSYLSDFCPWFCVF